MGKFSDFAQDTAEGAVTELLRDIWISLDDPRLASVSPFDRLRIRARAQDALHPDYKEGLAAWGLEQELTCIYFDTAMPAKYRKGTPPWKDRAIHRRIAGRGKRRQGYLDARADAEVPYPMLWPGDPGYGATPERWPTDWTLDDPWSAAQPHSDRRRRKR